MYASHALGVVLVVLGCLSSSIGLVMMKHSANAEADRPLWRRPWWWGGFMFLVVNATVIDIFAYAMLPLAIIAPFAGLNIVFSTLLAATGLLHVREPLMRSDVALIALTVAGVTTVSICGPREDEDDPEPLNGLTHQFVDPGFLVFAVGTCAFVLALVATQHTPSLTRRCQLTPHSPLLTTCNGLAAAACGALSQTFLKIVAEAIASKPPAPSPWASPASWASLLGLVAAAPLQLYLLNSTLASSPVAFAVPLYQSLLGILTIVAGATFFREFEHVPAANATCFAVGVLAAMLGLAVLSRKSVAEQHTVPIVQEEIVPPATEKTRLC